MVFLLSVRKISQRHLFVWLGHSDKELLGPWWVGRVSVTLHEPHEEFRIAVDCRARARAVLAATIVRLGRHVMALSKQVLERLFRP